MRVAGLASVFLKDHFRRADVLGDVLTASLAYLLLDPRARPYDWSYAATILSVFACVLPAIVTIFLTSRAGDTKAETFILGAGRARYYIGVMLAGVAVSLFWITVIGVSLSVVVGQAPPPVVIRSWAAGVALNTVLTVTLFSLLSTMCGTPVEPIVAVVIVILGLSSSWFAGLPTVWLQKLEFLVPPLLQNAKAASGTGDPLAARTALYAAVLLSAGILRFQRKEFRWS